VLHRRRAGQARGLRQGAAEHKITMLKGKVMKVTEDAATGDVTVEAEDVLGG
jgi:hypothetical protein